MIFIQTISEDKTDFTIITPSSGKAIYFWQIVLDASGNDTGATLNFLTSAIQVAKVDGKGSVGIMNPDKQGAIDEVLSITCGADTSVKILYDEV
jgi:hypothetical protein